MERLGRITLGASEVGSFTIDENGQLTATFHDDAVIRLHSKLTVVFTDNCTLETAIERVSNLGLILGFSYPSVYAAGRDTAKWAPVPIQTSDS